MVATMMLPEDTDQEGFSRIAPLQVTTSFE